MVGGGGLKIAEKVMTLLMDGPPTGFRCPHLKLACHFILANLPSAFVRVSFSELLGQAHLICPSGTSSSLVESRVSNSKLFKIETSKRYENCFISKHLCCPPLNVSFRNILRSNISYDISCMYCIYYCAYRGLGAGQTGWAIDHPLFKMNEWENFNSLMTSNQTHILLEAYQKRKFTNHIYCCYLIRMHFRLAHLLCSNILRPCINSYFNKKSLKF